MTLYDLKPKFQKLLMPIVFLCNRANITPNFITLITLFFSIYIGVLIYITEGAKWLLFILPLFFIVRMALNAIDGILAKEYSLESERGALLNEMSDILSDIALYLPFMIFNFWILFVVLLALLSETIGILIWAIKGKRAYEGPMGKSDRAFVFGAISLALAFGVEIGIWLDIVIAIVIALSVWTIFNRGKNI